MSVVGSDFNLSLNGATVREQPAIRAWATIDPSVQITDIASRLVGAVKVTRFGFIWHYEHALQNLTSNDGVQSFRVPIPHGTIVSNIGFHDVAYHSGEAYSGTDWTVTVDTASDPNAIVWSTQTFAENLASMLYRRSEHQTAKRSRTTSWYRRMGRVRVPTDGSTTVQNVRRHRCPTSNASS